MQQPALIFCSFWYLAVHWINVFVSIPWQQARWRKYTFSSFKKQERYDEKRDCRNSLNRWPVGSDGVSLLRWPAAIVSLQAFPSPFSSIFLPPYSQLAKKVATSLPCRSFSGAITASRILATNDKGCFSHIADQNMEVTRRLIILKRKEILWTQIYWSKIISFNLNSQFCIYLMLIDGPNGSNG